MRILEMLKHIGVAIAGIVLQFHATQHTPQINHNEYLEPS